jgi:phosphoglycolate phosphatase
MDVGLYSAVIFDLDGTLLDTLEEIEAVVNEVLTEEGFSPHDRETYRIEVGRGLEYLLKRLLRNEVSSPELPSVVGTLSPIVRSRYIEAGDRRTRPYDGIEKVLEKLAECGIRTAVITNKPLDAASAAIGRFFPAHGFCRVLGAGPGTPPKPAPDSALRLAEEEFGCPPSEVAFVGDTSIDMRTAVSAGMFPVGVLWGFRDREELLESGAEALAGTPVDLIPILLCDTAGGSG